MKKTNKALAISIAVSVLLVIVIVLINPIVSDVTLAPDSGASHYYWKLPVRNQINMIIVWSLFFIHLFGNYYLIRGRLKDNRRDFTQANINILVFNLIMVVIHYGQSIIGYDGLAQDVSVFSSQYSVIFVLVTIILMEIPRRGLIFGIKFKIDGRILKVLYATHGFIFTLAIVYTFWFHPVIATIGHLFGFFYMFLLFIQLGMVKTQIHTNPKWIVGLEVLVAFHGASVAYYVQNSSLWSMFFFGFGFMFAFTQVYGLGISKVKISACQIGYLALAFFYYLSIDITNIHQILWIPIIEYAHVIIFMVVIVIIQKFALKKR